MSERFESGLTWRSFLAVLYAIFVFTPAIIWTNLSLPIGLGAAVQWTTLILFVEIAKRTGTPLRKQEAILIFMVSNITFLSGIFTRMIFRAYVRNSEVASLFGLAESIPDWWAPPKDSEAWRLRTFFHPSWINIFLVQAFYSAASVIVGITLGLFSKEIFIEVENLEFPIQTAIAETTITMVEGTPHRLRIFSLMTMIGLIFGLSAYTVPIALQTTGIPFRVIPIPWLDLTPYMDRIMPGAVFGIATDLYLYTIGFIVPSNVLIGLFIGSISVWVFGNWLVVKYHLNPYADFWRPFLSINLAYFHASFYIWLSLFIGLGISLGFTPFLRKPKLIIEAFTQLRGASRAPAESRRSGEAFSWKIIFIPFILLAVIWSIIAKLLAPDLPIWVALFLGMFYSIFITMINSRSVGVTGQRVNIPYVHNLLLLASGYQGVDGWFVAFPEIDATGWVTSFKICSYTHTTIKSYIKTWLLSYGFAVIAAFIYTTFFWSMAPIPSGVYPMASINWPVQALYTSIWVKRPFWILRLDEILYGFVFGSFLHLAIDFLHIPVSTIGLIAGASQLPPVTVPYILSIFIVKICRWKLGEKWYRSYRYLIPTGILCGEGLAIVLGVVLAIIIRSTWVLPW